MKSVGMFSIENGKYSVSDRNAFPGESDNSFDDILVTVPLDKTRVFENDDLAAFGLVGLIL